MRRRMCGGGRVFKSRWDSRGEGGRSCHGFDSLGAMKYDRCARHSKKVISPGKLNVCRQRPVAFSSHHVRDNPARPFR